MFHQLLPFVPQVHGTTQIVGVALLTLAALGFCFIGGRFHNALVVMVFGLFTGIVSAWAASRMGWRLHPWATGSLGTILGALCAVAWQRMAVATVLGFVLFGAATAVCGAWWGEWPHVSFARSEGSDVFQYAHAIYSRLSRGVQQAMPLVASVSMLGAIMLTVVRERLAGGLLWAVVGMMFLVPSAVVLTYAIDPHAIHRLPPKQTQLGIIVALAGVATIVQYRVMPAARENA